MNFGIFALMMSKLIRKTTDETLSNFIEFFKMIVAYHKFNEKFNGKK